MRPSQDIQRLYPWNLQEDTFDSKDHSTDERLPHSFCHYAELTTKNDTTTLHLQVHTFHTSAQHLNHLPTTNNTRISLLPQYPIQRSFHNSQWRFQDLEQHRRLELHMTHNQQQSTSFEIFNSSTVKIGFTLEKTGLHTTHESTTERIPFCSIIKMLLRFSKFSSLHLGFMKIGLSE